MNKTNIDPIYTNHDSYYKPSKRVVICSGDSCSKRATVWKSLSRNEMVCPECWNKLQEYKKWTESHE